MAESNCDIGVYVLPKMSEFEDLRSTFIVNCVFNSFLSYSAIMLNVVTIFAIRKTSSLPKPLKTLLLSLAVSDVGVGFLAQPFYISLLVSWLQRNNPNCISYKLLLAIITFFSLGSVFGVVAITVDRLLAIHLHLRYQELVTHKRVVIAVISVWMFCVLLTLSFFCFPVNFDIVSVITFFTGVICHVSTTILYWKIYLVSQHHKNQMQALRMPMVEQAEQNGDMANFARLRKSAVGTFCVYVVFLVCYLPSFTLYIPVAVHVSNLVAWKRAGLYTLSLIFLNSSLNPVIYCWKMRHIRHEVLNILRNVIRRLH